MARNFKLAIKKLPAFIASRRHWTFPIVSGHYQQEPREELTVQLEVMLDKIILALAILFPVGVCAALPPLNEAADRLAVDSPVILESLKSKNFLDRQKAALTLGRIQKGAGISLLEELLKDKIPVVRATTAFALGQFGWQGEFADHREAEIQTALLGMLQDKELQVRINSLEALGKVGLEKTPEIVAPFLQDKIPALRKAAVQALFRYRLVMRLREPDKEQKDLPAETFSRLIDLAKDKDSGVREMVAYYFTRSADVRGESALKELAKDKSQWTSLYALMGLVKIKAKNAKEVYVWALRHSEYQNRLAAVQGLLAAGEKMGPYSFLRSDRSFHVRTAFAQGLNPKDDDEAGVLRLLFDFDGSITVRAEALKTLAKARPENGLFVWLKEQMRDTEWVMREAGVAASERLPSVEREKFLLELLKDPSVIVRNAALEALASAKSPLAYEKIKAALASDQLSERATAIGLLKDRTEKDILNLAWQTYLASADHKWVETRQDIVDLLGKANNDFTTVALRNSLNDKDESIRAKARKILISRNVTDLPAEKPSEYSGSPFRDQMVGKKMKVLFKTSRGPFTVECFPDEAPIHVADFIGHVKAHFYDGLSWHRVVPNFVVQGGDPDGTGYGDAGYSLRAEINQIPFDRGTLGMPRSQGFNTGGSQLFFTHVPTPHLDGQYTVFGKIIKGLDVLDRLERGDKILTAMVL